MTKPTNFQHPPQGHVAILYYDVTNDRFQVVQGDDVDTAIPAAAKSTLASALTHGYDGTLWRKQMLQWGYYDRLAEFTQYVKVGAGDTLRTLFTVPDGYVYVVNATMSINHDKVTVQNHLLYSAPDYYSIFSSTPTAIAQWQVNANLFYALKKDDKLTFQFIACDADDVLEFGAWGYKMKINM